LEDAVTGIDASANERHEIQEQEDSMFRTFLKRRHLLAAAAVLMSATLLAAPGCRAADDDVSPVTTEKLPNVPGKSITAIVVNYAPGAKSDKHHHAGSVLAYVLSGEIRSENSATGPAKVYKAGESFFEPPGSKHLVSENASATKSASLLAIFIADDGATLTTHYK
jgi:quercetin dioxygenase-like cupin family protein